MYLKKIFLGYIVLQLVCIYNLRCMYYYYYYYNICHLYAGYLQLYTWKNHLSWVYSAAAILIIINITTGWSKSICAPDDYSTNSMYLNNFHTVDELKKAITEYIRNVDHAVLNTVFENTVRRVNKCLETGGGHFEHYL